MAKFLNKYHDEHYLIFDLCKERAYDDMLFSGRVMRSRSMIDHGVCSLSDMFELAQLVHLWLRHNPIHCAVIHCKGGKGRTGLMVCACLMYDYRDTTVQEALEYFAKMRTNTTKVGKLQGVEAPSQLRYCKYFYHLLHITDVLKTKQQTSENQENISHKSPQQNEQKEEENEGENDNFYNMVIAASPMEMMMNFVKINQSIDEMSDDELKAETDALNNTTTKDSRIIDEQTKFRIREHLSSEDLNISGLKQSKHKNSTLSNTFSADPLNVIERIHQRQIPKESIASDVGMSTLKVDKNKLYFRGCWETNNPSLQTMLSLQQRFTSNIQSSTPQKSKFAQLVESEMSKKTKKKQKKKDRRGKSVSEVILERERDSTVLAQSLAKSKPMTKPSVMSPKLAQTPKSKIVYVAEENLGNQKEIIQLKSGDSNRHCDIGPNDVSLYEMMRLSMDDFEDSYRGNGGRISITAPDNNIISNDIDSYQRNGDHFVSVSNESYLSELFLKQPVVMKLKYVSIGPFDADEWNDKLLYWKIKVCMKRDFDYLDDMKTYEFVHADVEEEEEYTLRFYAFDNVNGGKSSLVLNGNICFKIYKCRKENGFGNGNDDDAEKEIGSVWVHSHFIPANYKREIDILTFERSEIDTMYKDKKHKTSIPSTFSMQIGYRCSRLKNSSFDIQMNDV